MEINIKCPKCKYEWITRAKLNYVTCPNCQRRIEKESNIKSIKNENGM